MTGIGSPSLAASPAGAPQQQRGHLFATVSSRALLGAVVLLVGTLLLYEPALHNGFISFDDNTYVTQNTHVLDGWSRENVKWAFTTFTESNWHPLTWLSHMADVQLFGMKPIGHHLVSIVFHSLNVALLFLVLYAATGAVGRSFLVAALWAAHPLNVENVAWIAERKSLLCAFFGFLAILAYGYYSRRTNWKRYLMFVLFFALSLMSKPMLVTLPVLSLLADYWPLQRWQGIGFAQNKKLLFEKLPAFLLVLASCVVTVRAQQNSIALGETTSFSASLRLENALRSCAEYVAKFFWPSKLAVFYPMTEVRWWQLALACVLLIGISALVFWQRSRRYLAAGWFWYLVALIPVIGVVPVGRQAMADRYMYLPMIGLLVMVIWGLNDLASRFRLQAAAIILATTTLFMLSWLTIRQTRYWRDSLTLFQHAVAVTENNYLAYNSLGGEYDLLGRRDDALRAFQESWRENPRYGIAAFNIGVMMERKNEPLAAIEWYQKALTVLAPYEGLTSASYSNLGAVSEQLGRNSDAEAYFRRALTFNPDAYQANIGLARVLCSEQKYDEAIEHLALAWKVHHNGVVDFYLGRALEGKHEFSDAVWAYQHALGHGEDLTKQQQQEARDKIASLSKSH